MNRKEIYYFLGKSLILDDYPDLRESISETLEGKDFPWESFVKMGSDHLILPAIYMRFADADLLKHLPEELSIHLKEIFDLNLERNRRIKSQILWMNKLLLSSGIRPVFIKGSGALLDGLYLHPAERIMADIDCLVSKNSCHQAADLLKKEGFSAPELSPSDLAMMHHWPTLQKEGSEDIDLHWNPVTQRFTKHLDGWEERVISQIADQKQDVHLLTLKDRVKLNFLHSQLQDGGQHFARVSLRDAYEFYKLIRIEDVTEEISEIPPNLQRYFNNYLGVISSLFHPFHPDGAKNTAATRMYLTRMDRNKTSRIYHRGSRIYRTLLWQFSHYIHIGQMAMVRKEYRTYLFSRLRDPAWFSRHTDTVGRRLK